MSITIELEAALKAAVERIAQLEARVELIESLKPVAKALEKEGGATEEH